MASSLILIGFMGSGKTAVGERLSRELNRDFFDADLVVEQRMGISISEAFATLGESGFRQAEERVVLELLDRAASEPGGAVISLGGGAVIIHEVFERLRQEPMVVFLDEDVETAFKRAQNGRRPLAADPGRFRELFKERENLYRGLAKFTVDTRGKAVNQVAAEVMKMVGKE